MNNKTIFVTGGASGLGKAVAKRYAEAGFKVCIADINDERGLETLKELQSTATDAMYLHCDVTCYDDIVAARDRMLQEWGAIGIVVNNAGVAVSGPIENQSLEDWDWIININLKSVVMASKIFTPQFKQQGYGYFVNVASAAGIVNAPTMSSYNVTKSGVISLSETLRAELHGDNIGVSVVCPTFFKTNLVETMRSDHASTKSFVNKLMSKSKITAEDIADEIYNAVKKRRFWVLPHRDGRAIWYVKRYLPGVFSWGVIQGFKRAQQSQQRYNEKIKPAEKA
jgi:NAD(P)-dependent dehydrogenase (short-subunit alcohol dehydrogenase family)